MCLLHLHVLEFACEEVDDHLQKISMQFCLGQMNMQHCCLSAHIVCLELKTYNEPGASKTFDF